MPGGDQVDILFCAPYWAVWVQGIYTNWEAGTLAERLMRYNPEIDKFHGWDSTDPTHWMFSPEQPKWDHAKFKRERKENENVNEYIERKL